MVCETIGIQYAVLKVCITCIINAGFSYNIFKRYLMNFLLSCIIRNRRASAYSSIAQSVEHAAVNRAVVGSSPTRGVFLYQKIAKEKLTICQKYGNITKRLTAGRTNYGVAVHSKPPRTSG